MALSETAAAPPGRLDTRRRLILAVLCLANFMVILDSQVTILAVPSIQKALQMTPGDVINALQQQNIQVAAGVAHREVVQFLR